MAENPVFQAHQQWIGLLQPEGLVVSATALTESDIPLPSDAGGLTALQAKLEGIFFESEDKDGEKIDTLPPFEVLAARFFEWPVESLAWAHGMRNVPDSLSVHIPAFQVTLVPTHVLYGEDDKPLILIKQEPGSPDLTARSSRDSSDWDASLVQRMDRLLRDTGVQIGIVATDAEIHLIYAPKAENSGHIGFPLAAMRGVEGRKVVAALDMLLSYTRVLASYTPVNVRLPALLEKSREAQNKVSEELAEQVLGALYELIKGIQTADQDARGKVLGKYLREHPELVYHGLLTVLMRLIFLLFAEDKGVMPAGTLWSRNYSVHGLFERLRDDAQKHGANMDKRYGAWGQLLTTFNLVYNGCDHPQLKMPARFGYLFDPKRYPFLSRDEAGNQPLVSDAIIHSVLRSLLVLGGERISYRALSVENIGVVYETMMGFSVYQAKGACVVLKGAQAPAACELDELMALEGAKRITFIEELTGWKPNAKAAAAIKAAKDQGEMLDALMDRIRRDITPRPLTHGGLSLQPGEERRKSGSHYTPPQLTRPLVAKAFEPHFKRMGDKPDPDSVLSMTICDPAMGSGAFLVEATRQLSDKLLEAWAAHPDKDPCKLSGAEERTFMAMRMVAQRCIYGVDRNPAAVDLAKMSMWLLTISKDHPFTFMDHSLRHGDALVGMSKEQIKKFHWDVSKGSGIIQTLANLDREVDDAVKARLELRNLDADRTLDLEVKLAEADEKMRKAKLAGDLLVYAWLSNDKDKTRNDSRERFAVQLTDVLQPDSKEIKSMNALRYASIALVPFHWELEFPEVFASGGFLVFVGNPPFLKGSYISSVSPGNYLDYIKSLFGHKGQADLVACFFVQTNRLLSPIGSSALIATTTISQGDSRDVGLRHLLENGTFIYYADTDVDWPGKASVIISLVGFSKSSFPNCEILLNNNRVTKINSELLEGCDNDFPSVIAGNKNLFKEGFRFYGRGFIFQNTAGGIPVSELVGLLDNPHYSELLHPVVGGAEILETAQLVPTRYVIDCEHLGENELLNKYPKLHSLMLSYVFPERQSANMESRRKFWWKYGGSSGPLRTIMDSKSMVLVHPYMSPHLVFVFVPTSIYVAAPHVVINSDDFAIFGILQSIAHHSWVLRLSGDLGRSIAYNASNCLANFPFPDSKFLDEIRLIARKLYDERLLILNRQKIGYTELYNQLFNANNLEDDYVKLREIYYDLNAVVLNAYGILISDNLTLSPPYNLDTISGVFEQILKVHERSVSSIKNKNATVVQKDLFNT
jgi:hypothetical protein